MGWEWVGEGPSLRGAKRREAEIIQVDGIPRVDGLPQIVTPRVGGLPRIGKPRVDWLPWVVQQLTNN